MDRSLGIDIRQLGSDLLDSLAASLENNGWRIRRLERDTEADLIITKGSLRYAVGLKVAREGREQLLKSLWANAYLTTRAAAKEVGAVPLPIVGTSTLSDRMVRDLESYIERYAPNEAFGMIDARGRLELSGPGLPERGFTAMGAPTLQGIYFTSRPLDLFSDLNQWMLKVLLAPRLPEDLMAAPRGRICKASELAELANVSLPSANRLLSALKDEGFLKQRRSGYEIAHTKELLQRWQRASMRPVNEIAMRFLLPMAPAEVQLEKVLARYTRRRVKHTGIEDDSIAWKSQRAALGLFTAAKELGFGFVQGTTSHLYLEDTSAAVLGELGLTQAMPGEAVDVFVRRPRWKESVFRAALAHVEEPTTDIIQTWLDVSAHPTRGTEQAEYIWEQAIARYLLEED